MRFSVHPCKISIDFFFFFFFFQQNSYLVCVVSDDVPKCVEVRHRKACKLLGINSLSIAWSIYISEYKQFLTL